MQAAAELHEMADRTLPGNESASVGSGVGWMVQAVPFHSSASVKSVLALLWKNPTAVQAVAELHDTPLNWLTAAGPGWLGVAWIVHTRPFQASAKASAPAGLS
jgi:hypothetical protein